MPTEKKEESKRDKFVRLAENRTNRIISQLQLLGNLSNKNAYEYSDKDIAKMYKAIEEALAASKRCYTKQDDKTNKLFHFDDWSARG